MIHVVVPGVYNFGRSGASTVVYRMSPFFTGGIVFDYVAYKAPPDDEYIRYIEKTGGSFTVLTESRIPVARAFFAFFLLSGYLRKGKYKICYINASNATEMFGQALAAFISGVPVRIGHSHSSGADYTGFKRIIKIMSHFMIKPLLSLVLTDFLTCSDKASVWMYSPCIRKKKKVITINNPVDIGTYSYVIKTREQKRQSMNLADRFIIGHIGRYTYTKNHFFILDIFSEILQLRKDAVLVFIGDGPLFKKVQKKAGELHIIDNIIFCEYTSAVNEFMQIFDVFLLPSRFEGLPLAGIEAQSTGLPCFFSNVIAREVDVTGNCHFLPLKEKPEYWAKKIIEESYNFVRVDCSDKVKQAGFSIEYSAKKLEKIFIENAKKAGAIT